MSAHEEVIGEVEHAPASRITSRHLMVLGAIIGLAMAVTLIGVVLIAEKVNDLQQDQIKANERVNVRQQRALDQLRAILHPTPAEYRSQLRHGIKLCLREPACRKLFPKVKATSAAFEDGTTPKPRRHLVSTGVSPTSGPQTTTTPNGSTPVRLPTSHRPSRPSPSAPAPSAPTAGATTQPAPAPVAPQPRAPVSLTAPLPVGVCTALAAINC